MAQQERKVPVLRSDNSLIEQEFESIREKFEAEMSKMEEEMSKFRSQLIASEKNRLVSSMSTSSATTSSSRSADMEQQQQQALSASQQLVTAAPSKGHTLSEQRQTSSSSSTKSTRTSSSVKSSIKSAFEEQQEIMQRHKQKAGSSNEALDSAHKPLTGSDSSGSWLTGLSSPLIKNSDDGRGKILKLRFDVTQYEPDQIVVKTVDNRLQVHAKHEQISENTSMYREYNREFLLPDGIDPELIRSSLSADGVLTVEASLPITGDDRGQL